MPVKTLDIVRDELTTAHTVCRNWRSVATLDAYKGISPGSLCSIYHGWEPKKAAIRIRLELPALIPAPACIKCGKVHVTKRCTRGAANKKSPRRVAVRCDDMRSAANTLLGNLDVTQIDELIKLLEKGGET